MIINGLDPTCTTRFDPLPTQPAQPILEIIISPFLFDQVHPLKLIFSTSLFLMISPRKHHQDYHLISRQKKYN
ncbi:hypothetical protein HanRHA438_Chr00c12g0849001 [Helianthus annuus]|nr:hypothetical protein HanRHA438_Chr00c12g0849001 [Helianthus annuus]